ncbi:MAG: O-antigen ligase family protein [Massilibacteroides sp.]|nr:O-antigen ligase family protein [Massilibacteroides sp.]
MEFPNKISNSFSKGSLYLILLIGLFFFILLFFKAGITIALIWSASPLLFYVLFLLFKKPEWALWIVFVVNYFIMGLSRYIPDIPTGIVMDIFLLLILTVILFRGLEQPFPWRNLKHPLTTLTFIWLVYCFLLLLHPDTSFSDWSAGIRGLAVYFFVFPLLISLLFVQYKHLKTFLYLWSVLTIFAILKALIQKYYGFNAAENYWLYALGGSSTHIIYTGIRYFSFFSDAAAFGSNMGLSMVVFSIYSIYEKKKFLKLYFFLLSLGAGYGLMISGTRAAVAIPFVGFFTYFLLSKQWKLVIPGLFLLLFAFVLFKYTYIGNGNINIYRIRSAFNATKDASFNARKENQKKMWVFMQNKPFGIGVGKAKRAEPGDYMYQLPTDTSLVYIWVETGMVGLSLFLFLFLFVLIKGSNDVLFKIQHKQLRGIFCAFIAGISGMLVCSYGNEMLQIFPNGPIVYTLMTFIMLGTKLDKQLSENEKNCC